MIFQKNKRIKTRGRFQKKEEFEHKLLHLTRVAHMKTGGRRFGFRAVVVIGDKKGKVGLAVAKGRDVAKAIEKAKRLARKKLISVPITQGTIPHQIEAKFSSVRLLLKPQRKGKGLIAGGPIRIVCHLAGIKDISSKVLSRTKNKMNVAMAAILALSKLKSNPESKIS